MSGKGMFSFAVSIINMPSLWFNISIDALTGSFERRSIERMIFSAVLNRFRPPGRSPDSVAQLAAPEITLIRPMHPVKAVVIRNFAKKATKSVLKSLAKPFRACLKAPTVLEDLEAATVQVVVVEGDVEGAAEGDVEVLDYLVMVPSNGRIVNDVEVQMERNGMKASLADAALAVEQVVLLNDVVNSLMAKQEVMDEKANQMLFKELKATDSAMDDVEKIIADLLEVVVEGVFEDWDRDEAVDMDWEPDMGRVENICYSPPNAPVSGSSPAASAADEKQEVDVHVVDSSDNEIFPTLAVSIAHAPASAVVTNHTVKVEMEKSNITHMISMGADDQPDTPPAIDQGSPGKSMSLKPATRFARETTTIIPIKKIDKTDANKPFKSCLKKTSSFGPDGVIPSSKPKKSVRFDSRDNVQDGAINVSMIYYYPTPESSPVKESPGIKPSGSPWRSGRLAARRNLEKSLSETVLDGDYRDMDDLDDDELIDWHFDIAHMMRFFRADRPPLVGARSDRCL